jgi:tRNA(fMet)-specific endonuclease VapC
MRYLLDTNIISDLMRNPDGRVSMKIDQVGEKNIFTSILAIGEVRYGIEKRGSKRHTAALKMILPFMRPEPWSAPADECYAKIRLAIEALGLPVGQLDMLLGAQALASNAVFVTANEKHFRHMPGLKVENWLR